MKFIYEICNNFYNFFVIFKFYLNIICKIRSLSYETYYFFLTFTINLKNIH